MTILPLFLAVLLAAAGGAAPADAPEVLHSWDERRAAAWAAGDPAALHRLYVAGSPAGRADVAMLRAWRDRGLHVEDLRMQLLAVQVERRSPTRMVLRVTDRAVGAVAVGDDVRRVLPWDQPTSRRVVLVAVAGQWRAAAVTGQARPARTTSSTVRSRNR